MYEHGRDYWEGAIKLTSGALAEHTPLAITAPYDGAPLDISVFIYCCNHGEHIAAALDRVDEACAVAGISYEVLLIDDASEDDSIGVIHRYMEQYDDRRILLRANKQHKGLAQNYIDGAFIGRGKYYQLLLAGRAESLDTLSGMYRAVGEADIVVPYYVASLQYTIRWKRLKRFYNRLLNRIMRRRLNDYTTFPMHLRFNVMRWHPNTRGVGMHTDMLCQLLDLGFTYKQVPCRTVPPGSAHGLPASWAQFFSLLHALMNISLRRLSSLLHRQD